MVLWISKLCEEFHCLPSAAWQEWRMSPVGTLEDIIEARAYMAMKARYDTAKSQADLPSSHLLDRVIEIDADLAREEMNHERGE